MSVEAFVSTQPSATAPSDVRLRVLVVEDHDRQSVDLIDKLAAFDIEPMRARTGPEAVRIAATERPDVIFVDGLLPGMHGLEVARFIRHLDPEYRPYIAMTTAIYKNIKYRNEAILKYGVDDYLVKPVDPTAIERIVSSLPVLEDLSQEGAS